MASCGSGLALIWVSDDEGQYGNTGSDRYLLRYASAASLLRKTSAYSES